MLSDDKGIQVVLAYVRATGWWVHVAHEDEGVRPEEGTGEAQDEKNELEEQERVGEEEEDDDEGEQMDLETDEE